MFFNFDSVPLLVTSIIISGLFSYSIYNIFTTSTTLPTYNEVGVQTESLVNTQPSIDTISELPETVYPVLQPNVLPDHLHVNVGVQTKSLFAMFKEWLKETFSINSSDIGVTPTEVRVENWVGNLDSTQIVSTNSMNSVVSNNEASAEITDAVVDYSYVELFGNVVETVISEATIQTANESLIQAANLGPFIGFGLC